MSTELLIGTNEWQHRRYMELMEHQDAKREMAIRRMAHSAVRDPRTYIGGLKMPWQSQVPISLMHIDERVSFVDLSIRLHPALQSVPDVAEIIAEEMIKEQLRHASL